jgi:N-methylhydantoinase A
MSEAPPDGLRIAVDIGGTFTDVVLQLGSRRLTRKILTTPSRPEDAVLSGMEAVLREADARFADIEVFVHGTTLATNAIIERRGAQCALIATQGFRDVVEIGNEGRYDQYDLNIEKPLPLIPRSRRFTVPERIDARGNVRTPLDEQAVLALVPTLRDTDVKSVAIAFLHGYANASHERRAAALLRDQMPGLFVSLASEVCPEIREYERTSTAIANAYVQPLMAGYLARMERALANVGFRGALYLVTSGGALTSADIAKRFPVRLVESGPAGGAIFAARVALQMNEPKVLSFDMGGTTAKICLIENGTPASARLFEVDRAARFLKGSGLPLRIPVIEMVEIGAGGGSIAQVDALTRVTVGPQSAASVPGPACYGRGGEMPTVTDADLVLGLLDPANFAGGSLRLHADRAATVLNREVGSRLSLSTEMAAYAVHEVICENMASAARVHAIERGVAIGQYTLVAFGGAAPLHVARVAEKIGVHRVIIPPDAGVGSAVGFLAAPVAFEIVRSRHCPANNLDGEAITALLGEMATEARTIVEPGAREARLTERRTAYMRYVGQGHEIAVRLPNRPLMDSDAMLLREAYEKEYEALFNRIIPNADIEIMTWSVLITTEPEAPDPIAVPANTTILQPAETRRIFDGRLQQFVTVPAYNRARVPTGSRIAGPAIITEDETSTFVSASFDAHLDGGGCIVMLRKPAQETPR